jgi:exopolysaccharide biosynthesis protein
MAITQDADLFSFELPNNGCYTRHNTSVSARMFGCQAATNAGFFSFKGGCVGDVVINNTVVSWSGEQRAGFGLLPNKTTLVGYVSQPENLFFKSMLTGVGWLVRNGKTYVGHSKEFAPLYNTSFVMLKAPRTSVGVMQDGSIFISVVDGIEVNKTGLDLWEYAEILIE